MFLCDTITSLSIIITFFIWCLLRCKISLISTFFQCWIHWSLLIYWCLLTTLECTITIWVLTFCCFLIRVLLLIVILLLWLLLLLWFLLISILLLVLLLLFCISICILTYYHHFINITTICIWDVTHWILILKLILLIMRIRMICKSRRRWLLFVHF